MAWIWEVSRQDLLLRQESCGRQCPGITLACRLESVKEASGYFLLVIMSTLTELLSWR